MHLPATLQIHMFANSDLIGKAGKFLFREFKYVNSISISRSNSARLLMMMDGSTWVYNCVWYSAESSGQGFLSPLKLKRCYIAINCSHENSVRTWAPHAVTTFVCQGPSFYLKFLVKRGVTPKLKLSELCPLSCNCILSWCQQILQVWCGYFKYFNFETDELTGDVHMTLILLNQYIILT